MDDFVQNNTYSIVTPTCELSLHSATEHRAFNIRISWCLPCELFVKVLRIKSIGLAKSASDTLPTKQNTYHIRLERRLILPLKQLSPIDAMEERMRLDLRSSIGT